MKGKADKLFANRSLSALVAVCMLLSVFSGLIFLSDSNPSKAQAIGDLIVTSATYPGGFTIQNMEQPVDGNVLVSSGGVLTIRDGTLSVISNYDPMQRHSVNIGAGGTVILEHGTITSYLDQIDPWPFLTLVVQNGGILEASGSSVLMFPGDMLIDNGAEVTLYDTQVMALSDATVNQYVVGTSGLITADSANDGPSIDVTDSSLSLFDSEILDIPEYPSDLNPAANLTLSGSSSLLSVNSYIGVDFGPASHAVDWYVHNVLVIDDLSHAYLYGTSFAPYTGPLADRAQAIFASGTGSSPAIPLTKGAADNTGQSIASLAALDAATYQVEATETMELDTWDTGSITGTLPVSSATLVVTYSVAPTYAGTAAIQWARQGTGYASTSIIPRTTDPVGTTALYDLPLASVPTANDIANLNVRFNNNGGVGTGYVEYNRIWVVFTVGADAFIYRWLNTTVGDEYGVPIPEAVINAKFTGATELEGQDAFYYTPAGVSSTPPIEVLDYLGVTPATFRVTDADGGAVLPYLTDIVTNTGSSSSVFVGSYAITGTATIGASVYSSSESFSFVAYPAMTTHDQFFDITVEVAGVSAPSPDPSRWLVVPPSLLIEDLTYYHAGNVIVAANGTLTVSNAEFVIVQSFDNQRTIYIDSPAAYPAKLLIQQSTIMSDKKVDIVVKGYATLEVVDSDILGVNIVATEHSNVILRNVTMDGSITTSWDSQAVIRIYDTDLVQSPVLSGNALGEFTNTSVPSVVVEDNAIALIYRWIHVTVYDGAGRPLPYADVTARFYVNNTFAGSAVSSASPTELGVAKVNALATNLTATGSKFVGNYRVNASYTFEGRTYNGTKNISVGVLPYTEPLGRNATYATMTIPQALPDLAVHQSPIPIETFPSNPKKDNVTMVNATVHNDGVVGAYNVRVDFYDVNNLTMPVLDAEHMEVPFATVMIPWIGPNDSAVATASWIAGKPLAPDTHNLTIIVDRLNAIPELDETMAKGWGLVTVKNLPDVRVTSGASEIYASTSYVEVGTLITLYARIHNDGDANAVGVTVQFWDGGTLLDEDTVPFISAGSSELASITWVFTTTVPHTIRVIANPGQVFEELSFTNNEGSQQIWIYDHPDLTVYDIAFYPKGNNTRTSTVPGGSWINVTAKVRNTHDLPISDPVVRLYINDSLGVPLIPYEDHTIDGIVTSMWTSSLPVVITIHLPTVVMTEPFDVTLIVNPTRSVVESDYTNNMISDELTIRDVRPDFVVTAQSIYTMNLQNSPIQSETFGQSVKIIATITNLGLTGADGVVISMGIMNVTTSEVNTFNRTPRTIDIGAAGQPNDAVNVTYIYVVQKTIPGVYQFWVDIDPDNQVPNESNRTNNFAMVDFTVNKLVCKVSLFTTLKEYKAGGLVVITANVNYNSSGEPVKSLPDASIVFYLANANTHARWPGSQSPATTTSDNGVASASIQIPTDIDTGSYIIEAVILTDTYYDTSGASPQQIHISAAGGAGLFPLWVWILIIVAVVGVVAGFTVYTYVYGLGKLVECGECGAFIPAASKRCPKCGVEFEPGTMKCSECGAWIPAESTECPNCGVKFIGETEEEGDYLDRMKKEYEDMRMQFRELAKGELGKKFSDKDFEAWWKRQPSYISFEDWLAKEEEKKKEGPIPCPVCGTLNPKEATVCHKCGTVFGREVSPGRKGPPPAGEEAEEEAVATEERPGTQAQTQQPVGQPRMVIRRPIEKRVVPKKIIKTPVSGEGAEGDQNQENQ